MVWNAGSWARVEDVGVGVSYWHAGRVVTVHRVQARPSVGVALVVHDARAGAPLYLRRLFYKLGEKLELAGQASDG